MLKTVAGALCALLLGAAPQAWAAQAPGWIGTWGAAPVIPGADTSTRPVPRFAGQTIRQVVRISAGGIQVRVRFTNEYGTRPLHIGAARLPVPPRPRRPGLRPAVICIVVGAGTDPRDPQARGQDARASGRCRWLKEIEPRLGVRP